MFIKTIPNNVTIKKILHPILRKINSKQLVMLDYRFRIRYNDIIPIKFMNDIIFVSKKSFIQNNLYLSSKIRKCVNNIKLEKEILGIGGESYMYLNLKDKKIMSYFYTNNKTIYEDSLRNNFHINKIQLVNYNKIKLNNIENCIINLSKLNYNLIKEINKKVNKKIIIISCCHKDFWKKIKLLNNFKLITRIQMIDYNIKYFVTINILERKLN